MRRFGLRLGLVLNPAVVAGALAVMAVVAAGAGAASFGLLALAGLVRIADIAATDGTTRTSINAAYQVVPAEDRLSVQAVVEGIGVPLAIGATGVLLLVLDALDLGVGAVIVFGLLLSATWTAVAVAVYRSYANALADEMRRRPVVASGSLDVIGDDDVPAVRALLRSDDARDVRLGLDLFAGIASPAAEAELRRLAEHADPAVRLRALGQLAALGDPQAAADARALLLALLDDPDPSVRGAALDAVAPPDDPDVARRAAAAARCGRPGGRPPRRPAAARCGRPGGRPPRHLRDRGRAHRGPRDGGALAAGRGALPLLAAALARDGARRRVSLVRAAAAAAAEHGVGIVEPALGDRDRAVVLAALEALDTAGGRGLVAPEVLDGVFLDAAALAARALAARGALADHDAPLIRALDDEIDLARRLVVAVLALRHGDRIRAALRVVDHDEGARRALGVEALDVVVSRGEAAVALPLVRHDLTVDERTAALRYARIARGRPAGMAGRHVTRDPLRGRALSTV